MKQTKQVFCGNVPIGGGAPVSIQSMTNTRTEDVPATVEQIKRLEKAGCDIVRVAVPTMEAAGAIRTIKDAVSVPVVARWIVRFFSGSRYFSSLLFSCSSSIGSVSAFEQTKLLPLVGYLDCMNSSVIYCT